ncbi:MAG: ribosomal protein [Gammaproteobacteria bacterium]|jgi:small subunit ribosomal protein S1|nr:ribosomal protein [Gammaproteobacteria bacterium]
MTESFQQLFEESLVRVAPRVGANLHAHVVAINRDFVIVDAGLKSECPVPINQFKNERGELEVNVGDSVEVVLEAFEDGYGETRFSREKAKRNEMWTKLTLAHDSGESVFGTVTGRVKGGFTVDIGPVKAFLPGSLIDAKAMKDPSELEGKTLEFRVVKIDNKRNNVVVSRRNVMNAESAAERQALLDGLSEGSVVRGTVKGITDYGAFIDLGGLDGLLHITDIAWRRVRHPSEVLQVGQELSLKVLKFDRDKTRVSLGLKQMGDDPWGDLAARFPVGTRVKGKVTNMADYGCFVEIEEGIEGLVHVSEMDWTNKNIHPSKVVSLGDEVEVMVLDIDPERRRISLGVKQCKENPWLAFADKYQKGDIIVGKIKSITDFGIFIGLPDGIDGLVHMSDISWTVAPEEAIRKYKKGDEVKTIVLAIDAERERISLGIKQLEDKPPATSLKKGDIASGKVTSIDEEGVLVDLGDGVEGFIKPSDVSRDKDTNIHDLLKVGDEVEAKVLSHDKKTQRINLSIKAKELGDEKEVLKDLNRQSEKVGGTFGDLLKEKIEE